MNQAQRETIIERSQKRREYLWKISTAGITATTFLLVSFEASTVVFNNLTGPHWDHCMGLLLGPFIEEEFSRGNYWLALAPILTICGAAAVSAVAAVYCRKQYRVAVSSPYVPRIRNHVSALPAEILLRGSEQPSASPNRLLRAASAIPATAPDESLRAVSDDLSQRSEGERREGRKGGPLKSERVTFYG